MSIVLKGTPSKTERLMIKGLKDCNKNHIKFPNVIFNCNVIEDANGNIFRRDGSNERGADYGQRELETVEDVKR